MRIILFAFLAALLLSSAVMAQEQPATAANALPQTRVESDDENGVIRFIVQGREAAFLDASGLHVRAGIHYGASMADYGSKGFDAYADQRETAP